MSRTLVACAALVALSSISSRADAVGSTGSSNLTYETVDEVEVEGVWITITGVPVGQTGTVRFSYRISGAGASSQATEASAARCDRLALVAMTKPGKFLFAMALSTVNNGNLFSCKLVTRTP